MKQRNHTFVILSAIGILLILLGHLDFPLLSVGGLLPYYSFHVMLFVFISGYFYKPEEEDHIFSYIRRKCLHLLLPYFIWNLIYGILATLLHHTGILMGGNLSLYNLFVVPFLNGHQFMYNAASWFVPALFLTELCNIIGRKVLSLLKIRNEYMIMVLYLVIGLTAVYLAKRGSVYDYYKIPGRVMFLAPAFQMGRLYKAKLESKDTLSSSLYFPLLISIQLIVSFAHEGRLNFSAAWVSAFAHSIFLPYITTITGIAFWLRIAKELSPLLSKSRFIMYLGTHTFSVMMHHLLGFFLINCLYSKCAVILAAFTGFDQNAFIYDIYYTYMPNGMMETKWLYLAAGLALPLSLSWIGSKIKSRFFIKEYPFLFRHKIK